MGSSTLRLSLPFILGAGLSLVEQATGQEPVLFGAAQIGPGGPSSLYRIDPVTAVPTLVGPVGFERISGMDFDPSTRTMGIRILPTGCKNPWRRLLLRRRSLN